MTDMQTIKFYHADRLIYLPPNFVAGSLFVSTQLVVSSFSFFFVVFMIVKSVKVPTDSIAGKLIGNICGKSSPGGKTNM